MTELFEVNLKFLRRYLPNLADKISSYESTYVKQEIEFKNDIQIGDHRFYGQDGELACKAQVEHFISYPTHYSLGYKSNFNLDYQHQKSINLLNGCAKDLGCKVHGKPFSSNLIALGSGLGFYLNILIEHMDYSSIIIVEPDVGMLYHFLNFSDLNELSAHCEKNGGRLCIIQPASLDEFSQQIRWFADQVGYGLFSEITLYRHYETDLFDQIFSNFKSIRHGWLSAWGFYDDEIIGIHHSLKNSKSHYFLLEPRLTPYKSDATFVIVGNGPSLDRDIKILKKRQSEFIIVSCGTAIGALRREGINSDFHVEMERSIETAKVQVPWFDDAFTKRTILLALNTVSPQITKRFTKSIIFPKLHDVGANLLQYSSSKKLGFLPDCNPTVTNFAVSSIASLGVKKIVLLGCDYGFRNHEKHHATKSDYFNESSVLDKCKFLPEIEVLDNNGRYISSIRIFNESRKKVEKVIKSHPNITFVNCSDGARIEGSVWKKFSDVESRLINKNFSINLLYESVSMSTLDIDSMKIGSVFDSFIELTDEMTRTFSVTPSNLILAFSKAQKIVRYHQRSFGSHVLFSGIIKYFSVCVVGHLSRIPKENRDDYLKAALIEVNEMWARIKKQLYQLKENFHEVYG
ncbi:motility associated factor glycosyltransferase family protein [Agarivorans sp. QJM3NY_33]|uniref:motility associated factor glycosyltransferase family protein n=1 Tax=Agarivorans sp. QJM3NY_33 TaxID=3421432 RepID=UPI003D7CF42D